MENEINPLPTATKSNSGCMEAFIFGIYAAWVSVATVVCQSLTWFMEQSIFEGSLDMPDLRWLAVLVYGVVVIAPALLIWYLGKSLSTRRFYLALGLAGLYVMLLAPARLRGVTVSPLTWVLQVAGGLVFWLLTLRRGRPTGNLQGAGLALLIGAVVGLPWLLWGAFGSMFDLLMALLAALLFGAGAARVVEIILRDEDGTPVGTLRLLGTVLVSALALLVMGTGLGVNGNQGLLALAVPVLALSLAALYRSSVAVGGGMVGNRPVMALLLGLAAFWPLSLVDPDELAAIISMGAGELIQWANLAAGVGLIIALVIGIILFVLRAHLPRLSTPLVMIVAGLAWGLVTGLYVFVGQPGLHGERVFVIFKEQADLSAASSMEDYQSQREFAYQQLVKTADESQADLRQVLDRLHVDYQPYYLENAIEVKAGPLLRLWIASRPEVDRVLDSPVMRPLPAQVPSASGYADAPTSVPWNLSMIGADRVWQELGITGQGIVVGQSDTGAQLDHPELADSYRGLTSGGDDYNWFDPWYGTTSPVDITGHGTHTLGTVLGNSTGVAPDAQWIGCVNLARNLGNPALYLDCMQFNFAPFPQGGDPLHDGKPQMGAHVLNNSWGCPPVEGCDPTALQIAVESLRAAGVFVVASAGNEGDGECSSLTDPISLYDAAYSVGAVDENGILASFSSIGPVNVDGSGRVKPDIVAPGVDVLSAYPGSGYSHASGTSMAGPHLVGVVALMWSANPDLIGDIDRTEQILNETARPYTGWMPDCITPGQPNNAAGYGLVDAYAAVKSAMGK